MLRKQLRFLTHQKNHIIVELPPSNAAAINSMHNNKNKNDNDGETRKYTDGYDNVSAYKKLAMTIVYKKKKTDGRRKIITKEDKGDGKV